MEITWIKMFVSIFSNRKIQTILKERDGDTYFRVWIQLLTIAGQSMQNGKIMMSENNPMTAEDLAKIMSKSDQKVKKILDKLIQLEMIVYSENTYKIKNWNKYQSTDKYEIVKEQGRVRQKRYRDKLKEKSNVTLTGCNGEEEIRKDTEDNRKRIEENKRVGENDSGFQSIDF